MMRKFLTDRQYLWLLRNLPFKLMYKKVSIDNKSSIWIPRWGYPKCAIDKSKSDADRMYEDIRWDDCID